MNRILFAALLSLSSYAVERGHSFFQLGSHCVGYKARKQLLLLASVEVTGKTCDILVQVIPEVGGLSHIEMSFPLSTLKSGEEKRDLDVVELLRNGNSQEFRFQSEALSEIEWKKRIHEGQFALKGQLKLRDGDKPVEAEIQIEKSESTQEVDGIIKTSFKALNIPPPKLAFGLFAIVRDDLELQFHFAANRMLGADSLLEN